uniref:Pecanex-like protein n=1 Tax=Panagrellus redivivus TaxID=6233 RepID=A0A7E4WBT0_PANRE
MNCRGGPQHYLLGLYKPTGLVIRWVQNPRHDLSWWAPTLSLGLCKPTGLVIRWVQNPRHGLSWWAPTLSLGLYKPTGLVIRWVQNPRYPFTIPRNVEVDKGNLASSYSSLSSLSFVLTQAIFYQIMDLREHIEQRTIAMDSTQSNAFLLRRMQVVSSIYPLSVEFRQK